MIEPEWLTDCLRDVLRWQLAHPGRNDGPDIPYAGMRVWGIFLRLHEARGAGGFGPAPISYEAMEAFSAITGEQLRLFEIDIIRTLDREWMRIMNYRAYPGNSLAPVSSRAMSPTLFDAVFQGK